MEYSTHWLHWAPDLSTIDSRTAKNEEVFVVFYTFDSQYNVSNFASPQVFPVEPTQSNSLAQSLAHFTITRRWNPKAKIIPRILSWAVSIVRAIPPLWASRRCASARYADGARGAKYYSLRFEQHWYTQKRRTRCAIILVRSWLEWCNGSARVPRLGLAKLFPWQTLIP